MKAEYSIQINTKTNVKERTWFDRQADQFETYRFGAMAMMMIFQSCFGSIAAMMVLDLENVVPLAFTVMFTMGANAVCIAQSPAKWCLGSFYASLTVNLIILVGALILR